MIETCLHGLREAARIVNVVREQRAATASTEALIVWAESTAARGIRAPQPRLGLELLEKLGLIDVDGSGVIDVTRLLATGCSTASLVIDRFPVDIANIVLRRVLCTGELASEMTVALRHCKIHQSGAEVRWG